MFSIFHGDVLIGRSDLEHGDPPMGVAFGRFVPTEDFAPLRNLMKPLCDAAGKVQSDTRSIAGLSAMTADGIALICSDVVVFECGDVNDPIESEVSCLGIGYPFYETLFPHHVRAYDDQFKK